MADPLPPGVTEADLSAALRDAPLFDEPIAADAHEAAIQEIEYAAPGAGLRVVNARELMTLELPPRHNLLSPWLPAKGLAMVFAPRGIGKTLFGLAIAYAVASGSRLLGFTAPSPSRVLYIDGEMPAGAMQERLAALIAGYDAELPSDDYIRFLCADLQRDGLPDLSTREGQAEIQPYLDGIDLIVLDNLSTLVRSGRENEAESWQAMQDWLLRQRRQGRSVLMIHHAGKAGAQRGTSKREDVLDTIIALRRPPDYTADQGARFEVHFEKARGVTCDDALPFEASYAVRDHRAEWTRATLADRDLKQVADLAADGMSVREIAEELGMSKSKVQRLKAQAATKGLCGE